MLKEFEVYVIWNIYVPSQVFAEVKFQFHIKQKLGSKWIRTTLVELLLLQDIRLLWNPNVHCSEPDESRTSHHAISLNPFLYYLPIYVQDF
jgi:hypothetical protein